MALAYSYSQNITTETVQYICLGDSLLLHSIERSETLFEFNCL